MSIMLPEIDFERIGQRVKQARIDKGYTQAELGEVIGCSNNHMSHIETGQTKVSLSLLLKLAYALDMDLNFFLMDTPYVEKDFVVFYLFGSFCDHFLIISPLILIFQFISPKKLYHIGFFSAICFYSLFFSFSA